MNAPGVAFVGLLAYLLFVEGAGAEGHSAFSQPPPGLESKPISVDNVKASSGRAYRVTAFRRPSAGQILYVAQRSDGSDDWISYLVDTTSKLRTLYRADAESTEALDALKVDFGLKAKAA